MARRETDTSELVCPLTAREREACDEMKRLCGLVSDADLVRSGLYKLAMHLDLPIGVDYFALRFADGARRRRKHG
jgi:hypothetical protein